MAVLSTKTRKNEKKSTFGLPGERKYPMPDRAHAANAKARATQMEKRGKLSASSKARIDAKADKILGEKKGTDMLKTRSAKERSKAVKDERRGEHKMETRKKMDREHESKGMKRAMKRKGK